jgi:thiamine pyrophosphate-dependent acetolactate synthase large subunit-like protein
MNTLLVLRLRVHCKFLTGFHSLSKQFSALKEADLVLLIGARLNWMLHFGRPPRFHRDVKVVCIDIWAEEFHQNVQTQVPLLGDIGETVEAVSFYIFIDIYKRNFSCVENSTLGHSTETRTGYAN